MAKKKQDTADLDFEKTLEELEGLVQRLEQGDQSLEQSLKDFERGVTLTRAAQQALKQAEQKVLMLSGEGDDAELTPFEDKPE
ncbi:MAG: exodeoxyribonuclease VII small subunit [Gammaproteobacteria bacterium]|nr:exodeoxyribonuclease VII small subunit [Gammaproteobacteria bacterium]